MQLTIRSPDGQALILSSSDGYCSIVVFDLSELGTVHPTQQHHRQLAAIAQSHSHPSAVTTPIHSPAVSTMRQSPAPARSEREESTSSSIAPHQSASIPPLFVPHPVPPSSTTSSVDPVPPTPGSESEKDYLFGGLSQSGGSVRRESVSSTGAGLGLGLEESKKEESKRVAETADEAPKKKRRVALTHLGDQ